MQYKLFKSANVLIHCSTHNSQVFLQPIYNPQRKTILSTYASDVGADNKSRAVILRVVGHLLCLCQCWFMLNHIQDTACQPEEDISGAIRHEPTVGFISEAAAGTGLKLTMSVAANCPNRRQNDDSSDTVTVLAAGTCCKWHVFKLMYYCIFSAIIL